MEDIIQILQIMRIAIVFVMGAITIFARNILAQIIGLLCLVAMILIEVML